MTTRPPRITELRVERYRALRDLTLKDLTPLTVLLGPNGSGKSTVFDVFAFLAECFQLGLRKAWDRRGRFRELRTRDADGPIAITLKFREGAEQTLMTYHLAIDEGPRGPFVANEWLQWRRGRSSGRPFKFLDFTNGSGTVISGEQPDEGRSVSRKPSSRRSSSPSTRWASLRSTRGSRRCARSSPGGTCPACRRRRRARPPTPARPSASRRPVTTSPTSSSTSRSSTPIACA